MTVAVESEGDSSPVTMFISTCDQAVLQGLLRRLYSVGMTLIAVIRVDFG
jgi:hypothetical protein